VSDGAAGVAAVGVRARDGRNHPRRRARILRHAPRRDLLQGSTPDLALPRVSRRLRFLECSPPALLVQARMEERLRRYEAHMLAKAREAQQLQDEAQREDKAQLLPDS
jgi:hypothetical protein